MPSYVSKVVFDRAMAQLDSRLDELERKPPPSTPELEARVTALEADVAKLKQDIMSLQASDEGFATALAAQMVILTDHEQRLKALEAPDVPPPDGGGEVPNPPVAECTAEQLPAPPYTMRFEATDAGPNATYLWKLGKNTDDNPDEDMATGRVLDAVTYPDGGDRRVVLTVTDHETGLSAEHTHAFTLAEPEPEPEPPPDGGGGTEPPPADGDRGDLYSLSPSTLADQAALKAKLDLYEGDAVIGQNLNLVTEGGLQRLRHTFDRRGLGCSADVSCTARSKRHAAQQEIYHRIRFATSPNFQAYDEACAAQGDPVGDMKLDFGDTVGGSSGRSGGLLSHNNAATGQTQGSLYVEPSFEPKAPGVPSKGGWPGFVTQPGRTYEFQGHFRYSTTPTSNDGFYHLWVVDVATGERRKLWEDVGFSTRGDTQDLAERTNGRSWCHNQSSGPPIVMYIDVFEYDIWSVAKKPSWAA